MDFKKMTDQELIDLAVSTFEAIYIFDSFGAKDMLIFENANEELEKRGYVSLESKTLTYSKA